MRSFGTTPVDSIPERFSPERSAARHACLPAVWRRKAHLHRCGLRAGRGNRSAATLAQRYRLRVVPGHLVEPQGLITLRARHGLKMLLTPARLQQAESLHRGINNVLIIQLVTVVYIDYDFITGGQFLKTRLAPMAQVLFCFAEPSRSLSLRAPQSRLSLAANAKYWRLARNLFPNGGGLTGSQAFWARFSCARVSPKSKRDRWRATR